MKKLIPLVLFVLTGFFARAQDATPASPIILNPYAVFYLGVNGSDTGVYAKSGADWWNLARQEWVSKYFVTQSYFNTHISAADSAHVDSLAHAFKTISQTIIPGWVFGGTTTFNNITVNGNITTPNYVHAGSMQTGTDEVNDLSVFDLNPATIWLSAQDEQVRWYDTVNSVVYPLRYTEGTNTFDWGRLTGYTIGDSIQLNIHGHLTVSKNPLASGDVVPLGWLQAHYTTSSGLSGVYQPLENQRLSTTNSPTFTGQYLGNQTNLPSPTGSTGTYLFSYNNRMSYENLSSGHVRTEYSNYPGASTVKFPDLASTTVADSATVSGLFASYQPTSFNIFSQSTFASLTGFTATGITPTFPSDNTMLLTGGSNFTQYLTINSLTNNDPNTDLITAFVPLALGNGIAIGTKSIQTNSTFTYMGASYNTSTNVLAINFNSTVEASKPSNFVVATADYCTLQTSSRGTKYTATFTDVTQGFQCVLQYNNSNYGNQVGNPTIWALGGTNAIHSIQLSSASAIHPHILVAGDSKSIQPNPVYPSWADLLNTNLGITDNFSSSGAKSADILAALPYVLTYIHPDNYVFNAARNDIYYNVLTATTQANITTTYNDVVAAKINPIALGGIPEPGVSQTAMNTFEQGLFASYVYPGTGWNDAIDMQGDSVHPADAGARLINYNFVAANVITPRINYQNPVLQNTFGYNAYTNSSNNYTTNQWVGNYFTYGSFSAAPSTGSESGTGNTINGGGAFPFNTNYGLLLFSDPTSTRPISFETDGLVRGYIAGTGELDWGFADGLSHDAAPEDIFNVNGGISAEGAFTGSGTTNNSFFSTTFTATNSFTFNQATFKPIVVQTGVLTAAETGTTATANGTYTAQAVSSTSGVGAGAIFTVVVSGGTATVTPTTNGTAFNIGDTFVLSVVPELTWSVTSLGVGSGIIHSGIFYNPINLVPQTAPTSFANGDVWATTSDLYTRINGITYDVTHPTTAGILTAGTWNATALTAQYLLLSPTAASFTTNGSTTNFTVTYTSPGFTPTGVSWTPTSSIGDSAYYITNITSTSFTVHYTTAPVAGTATGTYILIK